MKKKLPRKEKKKFIKEGGIGHYRVMRSRIHGSVSTEHVPVDYFGPNVGWCVPTELYLRQFRMDENSRKDQK